ncbi:MAG TPA: hypothetical protein VGD91_18550 [Trebonia sp.]
MQAPGQGPHIHVTNWFLLVLVMVAASTLTASLGLWLGTVVELRFRALPDLRRDCSPALFAGARRRL